MKTHKRLIARLLVMVIAFTSVDLMWLNKPLSVLAASTSEGIENVYDCYKALTEVEHFDLNKVNSNEVLRNDNSPVDGITYSDKEPDKELYDGVSYTNTGNSASVGKLFSYKQNGINATSQVKSGNWLNSTTYEAMAGTPTTEPLFVTYGGTQWLVDLDYRLAKSSYTRTYHFDASAPNYLYYKLGTDPAKNNDKAITLKYIANANMSATKNPADVTKYNYAWTYYNKDFSVANAKTYARADYVSFGSNIDYNQNIDFMPEYAKAAAYKASCVEATDKLQEMWDAQDDNYRADQGMWDEDHNEHEDWLAFMYTYYGMMRHSANKNIRGSDADTNVLYKGANVSAKNYANAIPVTYLNDWDGYNEHDSMDATWRSDICIPPTISVSGKDLYDVFDFDLNHMSYHDIDVNDIFEIEISDTLSLNITDNNDLMYKAVDAWVTDPGKVLDFNQPMSVTAIGNAGGLSAPGYAPFGIDESMIKRGSSAFEVGSYAEMAHMYFRSMYAIAIYMDAFFFSDEECLVPGLPGHDHSKVDDAKVAAYIDAVFGGTDTPYDGHTKHGGSVYCNFTVPFAMLPMGGDLDAGLMNTAMNATGQVAIGGHTTDTLCRLMALNGDSPYGYSDMCYSVEIGARVDYGWDYDYQSKSYYTKKHKKPDTTVNNADYCGNSGKTVPEHDTICDENKKIEETCTTCSGGGTVGAVACNCNTTNGVHKPGCSYSAGTTCSTCNGSGKTKKDCTNDLSPHTHYTGKQNITSPGNQSVSWYTDTYSSISETLTNGSAPAHELVTNSDIDSLSKNYLHNIDNDSISRTYREVFPIVSYYTIRKRTELGNASGYIGGFVESPKSMSDSQTLTQRFDNVQWLDITSYRLWHMNNAESKGLSKLIVSPSNITNLNIGVSTHTDNDLAGALVTKAINKKGYIVYNLNDDIRGIGTDGDYTTLSTTSAPLNDLQNRGRLANSFYPNSQGNINNSAMVVKANILNDNNYTSKFISGVKNISVTPYISYRASDVPMLRVGSYVNNDVAAYRLNSVSSTNDDLYFRYNPMTQGGRSHTCFPSFVTQALAHTLYYKDMVGNAGIVNSCQTGNNKATAYSNAIRVQGDYLGTGKLNSGYSTIVGQMYDTWSNERTGIVDKCDGGKFKLVDDSTDILSQFLSHCTWIPGTMSRILGRCDAGALYGNSGLTSMNNNFMVHTWIRGLNTGTHTSADMIQDLHCCDIGMNTGLGSANVDETESGGGVSHTLSNYNKQVLPLSEVTGGNTTDGNIRHALRVVTLNDSVTNNVNTETVCTVPSTLPLLGYQGNKNGTQDITIDGNQSNTQSGYSDNGTVVFDTEDTFVSDTPYLGGFEQYGTSAKTRINVTADISGDTANNSFANNTPTDFYKWYPWLIGLNVNRYTDNGWYETGTAQIDYVPVSPLVSDYFGYSVQTPNTDNLGYKVFGKYIKEDTSGNPNNIIIYNPVSTESGLLVPLSKFRPNAQNVGTEGYLTGSGNVERNQVAYTRRNVITNEDSDSKEWYFVNGKIQIGESIESNERAWELLDISEVQTKPYTVSDYEFTTSTSTITKIIEDAEPFIVEHDGTYNFEYASTTNENNGISGTINLKPGWIINNNDGALWIDWVENAEVFLPYSNFKNSYLSEHNLTFDNTSNSYKNSFGEIVDIGFDLNSYVPFERNGVFTVHGGAVSIPAGGVISLKLTTSDDAGNPITSKPFEVTSDNFDKYYVGYNTENNYHEWLLEAKENTTLNNIQLKCQVKGRLEAFTDSCIESKDIFVMGLETTNSIVTDASYWGYMYGNLEYSKSNESATAMGVNDKVFVNVRVTQVPVSSNGQNANKPKFTKVLNDSFNLKLKQDALNEPHKVYSTDWRIYILGWTYENGDYIVPGIDASGNLTLDTIYSSNLDDNKIVVSPSGNKYTLGQLKSWAVSSNLWVGIVNGVPRLWHRDNSADGNIVKGLHNGNPYLDFYNMEITSDIKFDTITFGPGINKLDVDTDLSSLGALNSDTYYLLFRCTNGSAVSFGYNVQNSRNEAHKYTLSQEMTKRITDDKDYDWHEIAVKTFKASDLNTKSENNYIYVSLDDEFTIHWDNLADLVPLSNESSIHTISNLSELSNTLGRGWENLIGNNMGAKSADDYVDSYVGMVTSKYDTILNDYNYWNVISQSDKWSSDIDGHLMDTTKWLADKYLVFNVDMYGFTTKSSFTLTDNSTFDPTTPAYDSNGNPNNLVFIPAGTKVHLGYQKDNTDKKSDKMSFVDYGNNLGKTNDPNGQLYTYHFWCPLSNGETQDNAMVQFFAESINATEPESGEIINYSDSITVHKSDICKYVFDNKSNLRFGSTLQVGDDSEKDEWGQDVYDSIGSLRNGNNVNVTGGVDFKSASNSDKYNSYTVTNNKNVKNRYTGSVDYKSFSIVGSIGGISVVDSADPRWQDTFKVPSSAYAISPIVRRVTKYTSTMNSDSYTTINTKDSAYNFYNCESNEGKQLFTFGDITDVRGREPSYAGVTNYNTYTTQFFKESDYLYESLPLSTGYNIHNKDNKLGLNEDANIGMSKLGYKLFGSLDTIGNYYGSRVERGVSSDEQPVNNSYDYGQTKVQVRPMYFYIHKDTTGNWTSEPVDVYMRSGNNYVMINSGTSASNESATLDYLTVMHNAYYPVSITTNTGSSRTVLDDNMLRYSVTHNEAEVTDSVFDIKSKKPQSTAQAVIKGINTSLLDSYDKDSTDDSIVGTTAMTYDYSYGNGQLMFMREYNRTFIGGPTTALLNTDSKWESRAINARMYGQKWYFSLGLPESAVFMSHGVKYDKTKSIENGDGYILVSVDVFAIGEKWILHYDSELSTIKINVGNARGLDYDVWSANDPNKYLIPITYYDLSESTSSADRTTQGTH